MVQPKPISLTQVDTENYDGAFEPQPLLIVGPVPGGGGGGVESIVAGTNVTVDDSDPQNPVISATGGGSSDQLISADTTSTVEALDQGMVKLRGDVDGTTPVELMLLANEGGRAVIISDGAGNPVDSSISPMGIVLHADLDALAPGDIGAATATQGALADTAVQPDTLSGYVPTTRTVAGYALTSNVPRAGLNTLGVGEAIFIPKNGTVPGGTPTYTIVIEAEA